MRLIQKLQVTHHSQIKMSSLVILPYNSSFPTSSSSFFFDFFLASSSLLLFFGSGEIRYLAAEAEVDRCGRKQQRRVAKKLAQERRIKLTDLAREAITERKNEERREREQNEMERDGGTEGCGLKGRMMPSKTMLWGLVIGAMLMQYMENLDERSGEQHVLVLICKHLNAKESEEQNGAVLFFFLLYSFLFFAFFVFYKLFAFLFFSPSFSFSVLP